MSEAVPSIIAHSWLWGSQIAVKKNYKTIVNSQNEPYCWLHLQRAHTKSAIKHYLKQQVSDDLDVCVLKLQVA